MDNRPLVSVCMITYNHERYIAKAIEGVLMQEVDFPIELVIGEDRSTDRTREICRQYEKKFPEIIRVLPRERNMGMSKGLRETMANCFGEFVAICEGDDYWTDPTKLSMQADFLCANSEYSAHCHNATVIYDDLSKTPIIYASPQSDEFGFDDIVVKTFSIPTCSVMYRNRLLADISDNLILLDWVLYLLLTSKGKIKFDDRNMAVYRQHSGGWTNRDWTQNAKELIRVASSCKDYFGEKYQKSFDAFIACAYADVCFGHFQSGKVQEFLRAFNDVGILWHLLPVRTKIALTVRERIIKLPFVTAGYRALSTKVREMIGSRKSAYLR